MDSPIRQYLKQKDYRRHKLFRKIKRRQAAERQLAIDEPIRQLKRKLKRYDGGKNVPMNRSIDGINLWRDNQTGLYFYQEGDGPRIDLTPFNTLGSDDPTTWSFLDAEGKEYNPRRQLAGSVISQTTDAQRVANEVRDVLNTRTWRSDVADQLHNFGDALMWSTMAMNPEGEALMMKASEKVAPLGQLAKRLYNTIKPTPNFVPTLDSNLAGIRYAYSRNPELANIGTLEEYNDYIKTIFPESKVRDINYHMGPKGLQELKPSTGKVYNTNPGARGIYVTPDKSYAQKLRKYTTDRLEKPSFFTYIKRNLIPGGWDKANEAFTDIYPVMVDIKNPLLTKGDWTWGIKDKKYQSLMDVYDAIVNSGPKWYQNFNSMPETIVPRTEQSLILGSDADVAGFREFMSNTLKGLKSIEAFNSGKDSGIHIKPLNRGKFTALKKRTYLKKPFHPTYGKAVWGDMAGGYQVYRKGDKDYSAPNFANLMYTKPPFKYEGGKDDEYYYQTQNTETGDVYNVHPSAIGAHNLEVTLPEVKITAPRKYEYRSLYRPEDAEDFFNLTGLGFLFNPFRLARTSGLLLKQPSFDNAVEVARDALPWSKLGRFVLGGYGLGNSEGVRKTYDLAKNGQLGGAALSALGDIFNAAMMAEGGIGTANGLGIHNITDLHDFLASPYYKYIVNKAAKNSPLSYRLKRLNMSEQELQGLLQDPVEYFNQLDAAGLRDPFSPFGLLGVEKIIHEHPEILKEVLNSDKTFKGWSEINVRKLFDEHDILLGRNPDVLNLLTALEDTGIGRDAVENAALNYIRNNRGGVTKSLYDDLYNQWRAGQDITKSMYDSDANKILAFDYYDKVGDKTKDAAKKTLDEIVVGHEAGHSRNRSSFGLPGDFQFNDEFYSLSPFIQKYFLSHRNDEVLLRLGQLYDWYGLTDYKKMSPGMLRFAAKKYADSPTGLNNNMNDFFKYVPLNRSTLDWAINSGMLFNSGKDSGIHIKPENRGKFNKLRQRTGKSASWFKAHGTPALKKMATFALNARKWKHK